MAWSYYTKMVRNTAKKWFTPCRPSSYRGYIGRGVLASYYGFLTLGSGPMAVFTVTGQMMDIHRGIRRKTLLIPAAALLPVVCAFGGIGVILGMRGCFYLPVIHLLCISLYDNIHWYEYDHLFWIINLHLWSVQVIMEWNTN